MNIDIKKLAEKLENTKDREELEQSWAEVKTLVDKHNPDNEKPTCGGCEALNNLCRKVWELSKKDFHTFKYQCQTCGMSWVSTFAKELNNHDRN